MMQTAQILGMKRRVFDQLRELAEAPLADTPSLLDDIFLADCKWRVSHPINETRGNTNAFNSIWQPLKKALPDLERRDLIIVGGEFEGRSYIATLGYYCGTFTNAWLGIAPTRKPVFLRYGEVYEVANGKIVQANCLWDILDFIRQSGFWPITPSLGEELTWPGPLLANGIVLQDSDETLSRTSLDQTLAMHKTLGDYNDSEQKGREGLLAMDQRLHWHPKMMWYGPAGIGTTRQLAGFVDYHQLPFRTAFPNRKGGGQWDEIASERKRLGGGHYVRIGDGPFSVTGGWPSIFAVHSGPGFLGLPATGRVVTMRVMDFYFHHEGLIRENWVPLDILDLLNQLGIDVLARVAAQN